MGDRGTQLTDVLGDHTERVRHTDEISLDTMLLVIAAKRNHALYARRGRVQTEGACVFADNVDVLPPQPGKAFAGDLAQ